MISLASGLITRVNLDENFLGHLHGNNLQVNCSKVVLPCALSILSHDYPYILMRIPSS